MSWLSNLFGGSKPKAPDPTKTANTQYGYNKQAMLDSYKSGAMDTSTPFGGVSWTRDANGNPTGQNVTLSPDMMQWLDQQFGMSRTLGGTANNLAGNLATNKFSLSDLPSTDNIAQTSYDRQAGLMKPQFDELRNAREVELANRGIPVGSDIWTKEMNRLDTQQNAALTGAAQDATLAAGNEYQRLLGNTLTERNQGYSELGGVLGMQPNFSSSLPTAQQTPWLQAAAPDYAGTVNNNYTNAMNAYQNSQKSLWGGIAGLGNAVVGSGWFGNMISDENCKEDRKPADGEHILMLLREMPVDDYRYKDEAQEKYGVPEHRTSPMAQDYARAFEGDSDGRTIDMGDAIGKLLAAVQALDARTAAGARR